MIGIKVCRGSSYPGECRVSGDDALNWGPDISDVLLTTEDVAKERGRVEIDKEYSNRVNVDIDLVSPVFLAPGSFLGIDEGGEIKNGMIKNLNMSLQKSGDTFDISTSLTVERNL